MGLKTRFKGEDGGLLLASIFNAAVGVLCLATLLLEDLGLIHMGLIGVFSLATAYGLFRKRFWALWTMFVTALMATAFALSTLYYTLGSDIPLDAAVVVYMVLTWIFTAYIASKRSKLGL